MRARSQPVGATYVLKCAPDIALAAGGVQPRLGPRSPLTPKQAAVYGDCQGVAHQPGQQVRLVEGPGDMARTVQGHGGNNVRRRLSVELDGIQHFEREQASAGEVPAKLEAADQPVDGVGVEQGRHHALPGWRTAQASATKQVARVKDGQGA